jgi:aldose 1-epimerase
MLPFSGRIANGQFRVGTETIKLSPNMPPEPHAIHGFGWQTAWGIEESTETSATLTQTNPEHSWPWDYIARQKFKLTNSGLHLSLSVTNHSDTPMPAGLGWHPYFNREGAYLTADTTHIWRSGDDMIPAPPVSVDTQADLRNRRRVDELHLDYAFNVGAPIQTIDWQDLTLTQIADPIFQKMIVYVPKGENFFCVEPATHAPDAVNAQLGDDMTGLRWLKRDETLSGDIELKITPT